MERNEKVGGESGRFLLSEIFALTNGNGRQDTAAQARAIRQLHARLSSSEFVAQMTAIFLEAKRAALAQTK